MIQCRLTILTPEFHPRCSIECVNYNLNKARIRPKIHKSEYYLILIQFLILEVSDSHSAENYEISAGKHKKILVLFIVIRQNTEQHNCPFLINLTN